MPLIHITAPIGTFTASTRDELAEKITEIALTHEGLPATPFVRSTTWIYFHELPESNIYHGGSTGGQAVISVEINVFAGGLDAEAKRAMIGDLNAAMVDSAGLPADGSAPIYILFRDIPAENWGVSGTTITLDELRHPHPDAQPY